MAAASTATTESSERQVVALPIDEGVTSIRGLSPQRLRFELEYALERGSTANSFLFEAGPDQTGGDRPAVLVHPPGMAYSNVFMPVLLEMLPSTEQPLLVVVGHVNPNRVALLQELARVYPGLELIASNPGAKLLNELWHQRKPTAPHASEEPSSLPPLRLEGR